MKPQLAISYLQIGDNLVVTARLASTEFMYNLFNKNMARIIYLFSSVSEHRHLFIIASHDINKIFFNYTGLRRTSVPMTQ